MLCRIVEGRAKRFLDQVIQNVKALDYYKQLEETILGESLWHQKI